MADRLRTWADGVRVVIKKCNDVERHRADTVFEAVDWYNKNIAASKKNGLNMYETGKKQAQKEMQFKMEKEVRQMKAEMEKKMEQQKQMYEAKLAALSAHGDAESHSCPALPSPPTQPSDAAPALPTSPTNLSDTFIAPAFIPTTSIPANPISDSASVQTDFWKSKYDRVADENAELHKAKVEDSAVKDIIDEKIEEIKQHYETQIEQQKVMVEEMGHKNAKLVRQLQDRGSPGEKRKACGDLEHGYGDGGGGSPKRARSE